MSTQHYPLDLPSAGAAAKTLPDRIAEHFIARIFVGDLAPGERLPADRELAPLLGVDRTSLRMAMQQLARMGVVKVVHGSGVRVLDYREHAGLDFLAVVFEMPQVFLGGSFLLQALDDWLDLMPTIVGRSLARATHDEYRGLDAMLLTQRASVEAGISLTQMAEMDVALQDRMVRVLGHTALVLLANSSRPLRQRLYEMYFEGVDLAEHVDMGRVMMRECRNRMPVAAAEIATIYRAFMVQRCIPLRARLSQLPMNPSLVLPTSGAPRARQIKASTLPPPRAKRARTQRAPLRT